MQADFFPDRLKSRFGIDALVPDEDAQARIHGWILDELVHGVTTPEARSSLDEIAGSLAAQGAQATLLGCTELGLLYSEDELDAATAPKAGLPVFDTARLHALAAARLALSA
jgi:aspartate racemase